MLNGLPAERVAAVIPARGGSKEVRGKNLRRVGGRPLVVRAVDACLRTSGVDEVYVSTDDDEIARVARAAGAAVITRPAELAGDQASSESALLHACAHLAGLDRRPEVLVFVQCTSPFILPADLDRGIAMVRGGVADSAFAAVPSYEFLWRADKDGVAAGVNHDPAHRPRRQDRRPDYRETGAFYVLDAAGFRAARHRFFGRTMPVAVAELTSVEIDTEDDLRLAGALAAVLDAPGPIDVDVVITDFDGVHTDDAAYVSQTGEETVRVSRADGLGIERLRRAGVPLLIVSKETNPVVSARAAKLGVEVLQGVEDKAGTIAAWLAAAGVDPARAAYVGNDLNDLGALALVGWPVAVADARPEVVAAARVVLERPGGFGAVRELCDRVIAACEVNRDTRSGAGPSAFLPRASAEAGAGAELVAVS